MEPYIELPHNALRPTIVVPLDLGPRPAIKPGIPSWNSSDLTGGGGFRWPGIVCSDARVNVLHHR